MRRRAGMSEAEGGAGDRMCVGAGLPLYLSTREAARLLRCSTRTLERLRLTGAGPRFLKAGKGVRARVLYRPVDIEAWLEATVFASTSEYGAGQ